MLRIPTSSGDLSGPGYVWQVAHPLKTRSDINSIKVLAANIELVILVVIPYGFHRRNSIRCLQLSRNFVWKFNARKRLG